MSQNQANEPPNEKENQGIRTVITGGDATISTGDTTVNQSGSGNTTIGTARNVFITNYNDRTVTNQVKNPPQHTPYSGTKKFVGRVQELEELDTKLTESEKVVISSTLVSITGMGGIGKTELALQYAKRYGNKYPGGICWLRARETDLATQIINDYGKNQLNLSLPEGLDTKAQVRYCWDKWFFPGDVLVIFNDVINRESIEDYLPPDLPKFKILVTTRSQNLGFGFTQVNLKILSEQEALELLTVLIGQNRIETEPEEAKKLCHQLGYLPLALELVGCYLAQRQDLKLSPMITRLEEKGLEQQALIIPTTPTTALKGVKAAFELSWQELNPQDRELACFLSIFALAPIQWSLVQKCLASQDKEELENIRDGVLVELSLVQRRYQGIYVLHPLIREYFQYKLKNSKEFPEGDQITRKFSECMLEQVKQILDSSEFTNPYLKTILDCLLREEGDNKSQIEFLNLLFRDYYSVQQYLYDTGYLETAINKLEKIKNCLEHLNEPKAQVVVRKMLGHAYYNNDKLYGQKAIDNMMEAQKIAAEANRIENEDSQMWIWYEIFLLDHVRNLLSKLRSKAPDIYPDLTYNNLEQQISILLPDTLERTNTPPIANDWFFVLRAAHYWGHRGNQVAFEIEDNLNRLDFGIENQTLEILIQQGINCYSLAAILRAVNLRLLFPEQYNQSFINLLQEIPYIPEWLINWNPNIDANNNFERFVSPSQAIGDIAHQYRGIAVIQLWSYCYYVSKKLAKPKLQEKLQDTHRVVDACIKLWDQAKDTLDSDEQLIKYYTWIANLNVMLQLAEKTCSGEPIFDLEEVITQVNQNLDHLEKEYGLVYDIAKERVREQIQKFYQNISKF